jgi:glycosyltransferase involved in cell wall biosynthesis
MPPVSIGLPVYNGEDYIRYALDSILNQTYSDFELIISDNASTDGTEQICRAYADKDKRIRYFRNTTNLGAAGNFNRVFEMSTGKYFKWISHDDVYSPDYVHRCVEVLGGEPSVVLCYAQTTLIDEKGQKIRKHDSQLHLASSKPHKRLRKFLRKPPGCNPVFGLIRADVLSTTRLLGNFESSDYNLLVELCLRGKFWEHDEYLFFRRSHPGMSRRAGKSGKDFLLWFDPRHKRSNAFPYLKLLHEVFRSVAAAPISKGEKFLCFSEVLGAGFVLGSRAVQWLRARSDPSRLY